MDIEKIGKNLGDKRKSLEIIESDISEKKLELDDRRKTYSRGILQHVGKGKQPASVETQKQKVASAEIEYQGLIGVKELLEGEITDLEAELKLAELFESDGQAFNGALSTCGEITEKMKGLGRRLTENIASYNQAVGELFRATEKGISSFSTIHGGVPRGYSLAGFLDGELVETETRDHDDILQKAGGELQALALSPKIDIEVVEQFLKQVQALADWQRTVAKRSPDGLILSHYALQRPKPKIIPLDGESARAERALAVKQQAELERKELKKTRMFL